jgi:hypothetical protein
MLLKIIAEIIIGHNRVINKNDLPGNLQPEKRLKSNKATQGAIHATPAIILPLLLAFTRLRLMALLSTPITYFMRCSHLRTSGRQRHRPRKQGQDRDQQYDGIHFPHYKPNINNFPPLVFLFHFFL